MSRTAIVLATASAMAVCATASASYAATYAIEFLAAQGGASDMNNAGTVTGTELTVGWCPAPYPSCYSKSTVVAWKRGVAAPVPLPAPAGLDQLSPRAINTAGWIAGTASAFYADYAPNAVVWKPSGTGYMVEKLGMLPGTTIARVAGIDDLNRIVGYNMTTSLVSPYAAPFLWDPVNGLISLLSKGFPNDIPLAISPGGTVALTSGWFKLDVPGVFTADGPYPPGYGYTAEASADINDAGDQARFLITSGSQNLAYFHRYAAGSRQWQLLSATPSGRLTRYGIGSIDAGRNITGTIGGAGVVAPGPTGAAQSLSAQISPAYGTVPVSAAGARASNGMIVARVGLGRSSGRLVRLLPVSACATSCALVTSLQMTAKQVSTCQTQNNVSVVLNVKDEAGNAIPGATVNGRFLDDYWLNETVVAITDAKGTAKFLHKGPGCAGAIAFLVDRVASTGRTFDRTRGVLSKWVIPPQ